MTDPGETESIVSLKLYSSLFSRNFVEIERLLTPCNGISILESGTFLIMESGIRENFPCGIRNPGVWNPEYNSANPESHNKPLTIGIQNPKVPRTKTGIRNAPRGIQNPSLSWGELTFKFSQGVGIGVSSLGEGGVPTRRYSLRRSPLNTNESSLAARYSRRFYVEINIESRGKQN